MAWNPGWNGEKRWSSVVIDTRSGAVLSLRHGRAGEMPAAIEQQDNTMKNTAYRITAGKPAARRPPWRRLAAALTLLLANLAAAPAMQAAQPGSDG